MVVMVPLGRGMVDLHTAYPEEVIDAYLSGKEVWACIRI